MSVWIRQNERNAVAIRRRRPGVVRLAQIPFEGIDLQALIEAEPPTELHVEATGPDGEIAFWLDDFFWLEFIQRWPAASLAIHFRPSPGAFLHPVITHQLNMLRRVTPTWRLVGHCYLNELTDDGLNEGLGDGRLVQAVQSAYHEVHVHEPLPQNTDPQNADENTRKMEFEKTMKRILKTQTSHQRTTPLFVRCRPTLPRESSTEQGQDQGRGRGQPARNDAMLATA